jgi:hypoxanthine phosphoribosyltransferase
MINLSRETYIEMCETLGARLVDDARHNGHFTGLVTLARGGFGVTDVVGRMLGLDATRIQNMSVRTRNSDHSIAEPVITQYPDVATMNLIGPRTLLLDEICDSGLSLVLAKNELKKPKYLVGQLVTAVVVYKPEENIYAPSKNHPDGSFEPTYHVMSAPGTGTETWVNFPNEIYDQMAADAGMTQLAISAVALKAVRESILTGVPFRSR